jgi:serine/threonine protein kinase
MLRRLGKYEILGELGRGAMGVVYRARDPIINRLVALKTISSAVASDPSLLERFYREAQSAGGLQHPNIVTIHDMGDDHGTPYIDMELIEGHSFEHMIASRTPEPISLKLVYAVQACRAFDYAHKRGIIHRDIKPGNIMVTYEGTVKVVDFGIARVLEASKTQTGMLIGTFAYMAPEQYQAEHADARSDIWSFGVLLFELLCYQRPFSGATPERLMHSICNQQPAPLATFVPDCPIELESILSKTLRKSPAQRYQSMEDLLLELDPICRRLQVQSINELVAKGRRFVEENQFPEARDMLRLALQIEPDNQQIRSMLDNVNAELKRIHVRPKAQQFIEKGRALAEAGKFQEARIAAENALKLDPGFDPAQELQRVLRKRLNLVQLVAGWLEAAKQHMAEGLPEAAEPLLAQVLEAEPGNKQAASLLQQAIKNKAQRQKRLRLLEQLRRARALWVQQEYAPCIQLLLDLAGEFPGEEEISRLLDTVRADQVEQRRQVLQDCRNLLDAANYDDCFNLLTKLQEQFPEDNEIAALLEKTRREQSSHRRLLGLMEAKGLLLSGQHEEGIAVLIALRWEFPNESEIDDLLETARQDQRQHHHRSLTKARELLTARQYGECVSLLTSLEKQFPRDDQIPKLLAAVKTEQRKREHLAEARRLLASHRHDESIAILSALQTDFPNDPAIPKLLDTARGDRAEHQKQQKLAEAKAQLAAQSFTEAISLLDALAMAHPQDAVILKLRAAAQREREKHARAERIELELDELKKLLNEKRYSQVASKAKQLVTEFPGETSFRRLAEFADGRRESVERQLLLHGTVEEVKALFAAGRFRDAISAAQAGLKTFPSDPELLDLCQQAEIEHRKLEKRQQMEKRVREIKVQINREKLSDAIDLAKQTLRAFGPDTDVIQLLNSAEVELESREKKRTQLSTIETIRTLIDSGAIEGANRAIDEVLKTKTFEPFDPRIQRLSEQIQDAKAGRTQQIRQSPAFSGITREYARSVGTSKEKISPQPISTGQGAAVRPARMPEAAPANLAPEVISSEVTRQVPGPGETRPPEQPGDFFDRTAESKRPAPATAPDPCGETSLAYPRSAAPWHRRPTVIAALIVASAVAAWSGLHSLRTRTLKPQLQARSNTQPPKANMDELQAQEGEALNAAGLLIAADDLGEAQTVLVQAASLNGPLTSEISRRIKGVEESMKDRSLRELRRREEQFWQRALQCIDEQRYGDARADVRQILALRPGGMHREDAQRYLERVIPQQTQEAAISDQVHLGLIQGDFQAARSLAQKLTQSGVDASDLLAQVDRTERRRFAQLQARFDDVKKRDDQGAVDELNALWQKFQALSAAGGPTAGEAVGYMNEIPVVMGQIQSRLQEKNADAVFQRMLQRYRQATTAKNKDSLAAARTDFESVVKAGGPHAKEAENYLAAIDSKLRPLEQPPMPPPETPVSPDVASVQAVIHSYVQAFDLKDADALRQVWPNVVAQYDAYKKWFEDASAIRMRLKIETTSTDTASGQATLKGQVNREYTRIGAKTTNSNYSVIFHLTKQNGAWIIDNIEIEPES